MTRYAQLSDEVAAHGLAVRGGFTLDPDGSDRADADREPIRLATGVPARAVVIIGNVGDAMWSHFEAERTPGPDPLDRWTTAVLGPIAERYGAEYRHPSEAPYIPMQRWAMRADAVFPSPIGILIDPVHGLWHAYRGAFLFEDPLEGIPARASVTSPCLTCRDRPCLTECPVDAFDTTGYDATACRDHVKEADTADCVALGCAARRACPVGTTRYTPDQVAFHMAHFVGL